MTVGINCGHTASGPGSGAVGIINESEHTRLVGQALMGLLRAAGINVIDCTIDWANTQMSILLLPLRWLTGRISTGLSAYILMLLNIVMGTG